MQAINYFNKYLNFTRENTMNVYFLAARGIQRRVNGKQTGHRIGTQVYRHVWRNRPTSAIVSLVNQQVSVSSSNEYAIAVVPYLIGNRRNNKRGHFFLLFGFARRIY